MTIIQTEMGDIEIPEIEAKALNYRGYLGNSLLKRAGVQIEWNAASVEEYLKCKEDPVYFIESHVKIVHVDLGLIPFKLRLYQLELIHNIHNNRRNIITMARQSGKSTAVIGYLLWYILFNDHKTVMLLANKADTAREILGKLQLAYMYLPMFIQQGIIHGGWNKGSVLLENGSRALAESTASDSIRGYTANILVLDEAAHVDHWEEFSKSVMPTITSGITTKIIQISTPKGLNHFYKTWQLAQYYDTKPEELPPNVQWNGYKPLLVTWQQVPGRDEVWYKETLAEMNFDTDKFAQEYSCQFMGSSGTLIAGWKLKELVAQIPIYQKEGLSKYENPVKDHAYSMTVDVSEGKGLDYSTFNVIDITAMPYNQVCTFRSNLIAPAEFAQIIHQTAIGYNNASVLIEYTSLGPGVSDALFNDLSYENVLHTESAGSRGKRISMLSGKVIDRGIKMSVSVKATGCSLMKLLIEQNQLIINDHDTIEELSRFSRKNNTWAAEEGWHDDLTMSLVIFAWLSNQDYFTSLTDINTLGKLREHTEAYIESQLTPFGFMPEPAPINPDWKDPSNDPWAMSWRKEEYYKDVETLPNF